MRLRRRDFLATVGQGMLIAGVGYQTAFDMGLTQVRADDAPRDLTFGDLEPLVAWMQETPPQQLVSEAIKKLKNGTDLKQLVTAASLANARAFGGEDYIGFHTLMALGPAYQMAQEAGNTPEAALPVLKVLYRNANRLQESGAAHQDQLHAIAAQGNRENNSSYGTVLRAGVEKLDYATADQAIVNACSASAEEGYQALLEVVEDATEVHRVVLANRAWDLLEFVGIENATTLLRQSVHYCVKNQEYSSRSFSECRAILPKLFEQFQLEKVTPGTKKMDEAWLAEFSTHLYKSTAAQSAEGIAAAIKEGIDPTSIFDAIAITTNELVLRDRGRVGNQIQDGKPAGSVHGDSIGVHASDSAHAWRGIGKASNQRNLYASLILSGYQSGLDRVNRGGDFQGWEAYPLEADRAKITTDNPKELITLLDSAMRNSDQASATAITERYGRAGHDAAPLLDLLRLYATKQDGALHAEKYYFTATTEFRRLPSSYRWKQLQALARVLASGAGYGAPGLEEAREQLVRG